MNFYVKNELHIVTFRIQTAWKQGDLVIRLKSKNTII